MASFNVSILHLKGEYSVRAVMRATPLFYVTWCPLNCRLRMAVVKGRCARDALTHTFNIVMFIFGKANYTTIKHIYNGSTNWIESCVWFCICLEPWSMKKLLLVVLILTAMICGISHKRYSWLAWRVWWHTLSFVTHGITWQRVYVIKPTAMGKKWCHFKPKSTQSCYNTYRNISNISRTLVGNKIVDHSDVVGASPVGAAPTTSSFST